MPTMFEEELWIITLQKSKMKWFIQRGNSSESSYNNERWPFPESCCFLLLFLELIILITVYKSRSFQFTDSIFKLKETS